MRDCGAVQLNRKVDIVYIITGAIALYAIVAVLG